MMQNQQQYDIYFLLAEKTNRCKIGITRCVEQRMKELDRMSPVKLRLMGTVSGDHKAEKAIHDTFDQLRVKGEWFKYESPLTEFIDKAVMSKSVQPIQIIPSDKPKNTIIKLERTTQNMLFSSPYECIGVSHIGWDSEYGDFLVTFGKYEGCYLNDLIQHDSNYIDWILENFEPSIMNVVAHAVNRMRIAEII